MSYTNFKIDSSRHSKMKEMAKINGRYVIDEYREAIDSYISKTTQDIMLADTQLENYINNRVKKTEDRLAAMLARNGMDTSIILMGLMRMLSNLTSLEKKELYNQLRKEASSYFSRPLNEKRND